MKAGQNLVQVNIYLTPEQIERLDALAREKSISRASYVRMLIAEHIREGSRETS